MVSSSSYGTSYLVLHVRRFVRLNSSETNFTIDFAHVTRCTSTTAVLIGLVYEQVSTKDTTAGAFNIVSVAFEIFVILPRSPLRQNSEHGFELSYNFRDGTIVVRRSFAFPTTTFPRIAKGTPDPRRRTVNYYSFYFRSSLLITPPI